MTVGVGVGEWSPRDTRWVVAGTEEAELPFLWNKPTSGTFLE
jgi:hypothetical protein